MADLPYKMNHQTELALQPTLPTTRIGGWSSGGAGHQGADVGGNGPCRWHESAALRIGASPGLELADGPLVAGLSIQGGSPLAHQVCGRRWMQHRHLLS
jgi:hypothetical protein